MAQTRIPTPQLLYTLAKLVSRYDFLDRLLTKTELEYFKQALTSFQEWQTFIQLENTSTPLSEHQRAAFRVRVMLAEQLIPCLFGSDCPGLLEQEPVQTWTESNNTSPRPNVYSEDNDNHLCLFDVYHTLEFDMAAMLEHKEQLDEIQAQEAQEQEMPQEKKLTLFHDMEQFNLKYLLKGIVENRDKTTLSDRELKSLLLDVKSKSKWNGKSAQEDLYEACEKVLTELKNYTEHSFPFLTKVSKREAPDYLDVIKEPMDLGTMTRKLKHFEYKSKKEFARDLYLIYENCFEYNTNPASEYRKHAAAMRRKTDRLLVRVPDIEIKEERQSQDDFDFEEDSDHDLTEASPSVRERSVTHDSIADETIDTTHTHHSGKYPLKTTTTTLTQDTPLSHEGIDLDYRELLWLDKTKKTRAKIALDIEREYQFDFGNRHVIRPSSFDIQRFAIMEHLYQQPHHVQKLARCSPIAFLKWMSRNEGIRLTSDEYNDALLSDLDSDDEQGGFFSKRSDKPKLSDQERDDLFLPEYLPVFGLPDIEGLPSNYDSDEESEALKRPTFDSLPTIQSPQHGLSNLIHRNIDTLSKIRTTHSKCKLILNDTLPNPSPSNDDGDNEFLSSPIDTPIPFATTPSLAHVELNQEAVHCLLQRTIVSLLSHAGFEGVQGRPLNILTELMSNHLFDIFKILRHYWDDHNKTMTGEEIVTHALREGGVNQLDDLDSYVSGLQSYGQGLDNLQQKLEQTYEHLVNGEDQADASLLEEDEAFVTGLFGQDVVEDYFGFNEIGLDLSQQIPAKLWFGNDVSKINRFASTKKQKEIKYPPPPNFIPVTNQTQWIGLLQPWYQKNPERVEDEYSDRKKRSRYPPVHLRSAIESKKRVSKDEEKKRKRKEKALKKRIRNKQA